MLDAEQQKNEAAEATQRDCGDVAPGQTFSMEVEDEELRIVIRGRQLPFTIFGFNPNDKPIGTYDEPVITTSAPRIGPGPRVSKSGVPRVEPPAVASAAGQGRCSGCPPRGPR